MAREYSVIVERGEDGYLIGTVPEVAGCFTQRADIDELMRNVREVLPLCLEEMGVRGEEPLEFLVVRTVSV